MSVVVMVMMTVVVWRARVRIRVFVVAVQRVDEVPTEKKGVSTLAGCA